VAYELDGELIRAGEGGSRYPLAHELSRVQPQYREFPGWTEDITMIREFAALPQAAADYVLAIESLTGCRIRYVSVGPERSQLIDRGPIL
jgi:adenylosuccinate synthase